MALQLRPRHRVLHNPSLFQFFSTSSDPTDPTPPAPQTDSADSASPASQPRRSFLFSDVRASLRTPEPSQRMRQHLTGNHTLPHQQQQRAVTMDEIRKGLSEFPARSGTGEQRHSYAPRMSSENVSSGSDPSIPPANITYSSIFKSFKNNTTLHKPAREDPFSLSGFKKVLKLKPDSATSTRTSLFGRDENEEGKIKNGVEEAATTRGSMNTHFYKMYSEKELGEKLRNLRSREKKGKDDVSGGFSFLEMNERLAKLREMEERGIGSRIGVQYAGLKNSLMNVQENKAKNTTARSIDILGQWASSPESMKPPQEHLVEKYFHPDNMSSAEKLKIELAKVRDEFKMSESDCGSARVQVAQLTTKIKHLSATLHKKDKHSRKGLDGMVQKRKNLLRYLRRTDWDSYCLVLSKLGLRDNPAYKL